MHRFVVDPNGTGAAIAGITSVPDPETTLLPQEAAQTLSGVRRRRNDPTIDLHAHGAVSSCRISSAKIRLT
jgi:hypothetical protein